MGLDGRRIEGSSVLGTLTPFFRLKDHRDFVRSDTPGFGKYWLNVASATHSDKRFVESVGSPQRIPGSMEFTGSKFVMSTSMA